MPFEETVIEASKCVLTNQVGELGVLQSFPHVLILDSMVLAFWKKVC